MITNIYDLCANGSANKKAINELPTKVVLAAFVKKHTEEYRGCKETGEQTRIATGKLW